MPWRNGRRHQPTKRGRVLLATSARDENLRTVADCGYYGFDAAGSGRKFHPAVTRPLRRG